MCTSQDVQENQKLMKIQNHSSYMCGSSLSPCSFTITPILPFLHFYPCSPTKHKTLETWNKHVLRLRKQIKRTQVLFIFGWLEIPMEKKWSITIFPLILFQVETKTFWRAEFLNIWTFWIQEHLFQCWNTLVQHLNIIWKELMV